MTDRLAYPEADRGLRTALEPVTGVAAGALGTAANLDDTQRYSVDDLRQPAGVAAEPEAPVVEAPERSTAPPPPVASIRAGSIPGPHAPMASARTGTVVARRPIRRASGLRSRRAGAVALGALVVALAAALTLRDGAQNGGVGGPGVDDVAGAAGTFPPLPGFIAAETPAPVATPGVPGGHPTGRGHGHGRH